MFYEWLILTLVIGTCVGILAVFWYYRTRWVWRLCKGQCPVCRYRLTLDNYCAPCQRYYTLYGSKVDKSAID